MKVKLLLVGKNKDAFIENYIYEYQKRLKAFVSFELKYVKETKSAADEQAQKKAEATSILNELSKDDLFILLDERGEGLTSVKFSEKIKTWQLSGKKSITFLIGGAYGVDKSVSEKADALVSLSAMTFTHQMARVFFMEQLYRAFTIINKTPYHH